MKRATAAVTAGFTLLLGGCATTEPPAQLSEANETVTNIRDNPAVSRYAPAALYEAQQALETAQQLYKEGAPVDSVEHFAYLAERQAQIAEAQARRSLVYRSVAEAQQQRQQLALQQREQALALALTEAQRAQQEAARLRQQAQQQQTQLQEAQQRLAELEPQQTDRGIVLTLDEVLFGFNEATLDAGNAREIDRLAQFLENNPDYNILIEGHTDAVGSNDYNQRLSEQRAQAVREALAQRGVDPQRVRTVGLGEEFPVAPNETDQGRLQNRRVEVVIAEDQMPPTRREAQIARDQQQGQAGPQG